MNLTPLNRIRVETALSRFPVHCLSKRGTISIDLQQAAFRWKVSYNTEFGRPGPLAYKVDTLIVNRRIDEAPRPLPQVIELGSLREICRQLGITDHNTETVKTALHQNASAYITAKIRYRTKTGRDRWTEIGYTRYSVAFAGEILPDGSTADTVCIVINPAYRELLNQVEVRPLDYDYLVKLAPGPQRFYELLSFQIYGAIASGRPRAKMLYSDYCKYAPQTQYSDFDHMKKQMYKIHLPHRQSGYIVKIDYQKTTYPDGTTDWEMLYTPGPKAIAEYHAFTNRQARQYHQSLSSSESVATERNKQPVQACFELSDTDNRVLSEMTRRGITEKKARFLLMNLKPGQEVVDQLEYIDHLVTRAPRGKFHNPPGLYISAIQENCPVPDSFITSRKQRLWEEAQQAKHTEYTQRAQREIEYDKYQAAEIQRYISEVMPQEEYQRIFAQRCEENRRIFKQISATQLDEFTGRSIADELKQSGRVPLLSFEEFCRQRS